MKKKLPERLYYPIPEAAEFLGCSIRDIYHFCATGMINLTAYLDVNSKDVGYISLDLGNSEPTLDPTGNWSTLLFDTSSIYGIRDEVVNLEGADETIISTRAEFIDGFFYVNSWDCYLLELSNKEKIPLSGVEATDLGGKGDGVYLYFNEPFSVARESLCILSHDIINIKHVDNILFDNHIEHPKTSNRKGEIIPALLKMIPEFKGVDVDTEKVCKLASILEATAASKGVELKMPDKNTWAKYLGREATPLRRRK